MFPIIGIVTVFTMVFGVFLMEGGSFEVLAEAAPMEFLMIFGAAVGAAARLLFLWLVSLSLVLANPSPGLVG